MEEKDSTTIRRAVINKAIGFIFDNIEKEITVDDVAKHCGYSKYHLMRMFKEDTDEALYQFMKRVRLERSAWRLKVEKDKSVAEIGIDYGYSSSNFATAFKKHLNISPVDFRKKSEQLVEQSSFAHGISIDELEKSENLITVEKLDSFLVVYELCQTISPAHLALKEGSGILTHIFEGGKYAVYHYKGFPQFLFVVYQEVFCRWLSKTGNQLDNRSIFDIYRNIREDGYMEIDICFPLK